MWLPGFAATRRTAPDFTISKRHTDAAHPGYVGKQYIEQFLESGELESRAGFSLHPKNMHVYLCGNPSMIGLPQTTPDDHVLSPESPGVIETLVHRGFPLETARVPGNIHYEKYWQQTVAS
jgi:ferredoxin--NADP+ reductase